MGNDMSAEEEVCNKIQSYGEECNDESKSVHDSRLLTGTRCPCDMCEYPCWHTFHTCLPHPVGIRSNNTLFWYTELWKADVYESIRPLQ